MARSVISIDRDEDVYVGIGFPLNYSISEGFFTKTITVLQQAKHNLRNLLLTTPGERVGQPEFGSRLKYVVFEQQSPDIDNLVEEVIRSATDKFLPHINILNVFTNKQDNTLNVSIEFSVPLNPEDIETLEFDFRIGD